MHRFSTLTRLTLVTVLAPLPLLGACSDDGDATTADESGTTETGEPVDTFDTLETETSGDGDGDPAGDGDGDGSGDGDGDASGDGDGDASGDGDGDASGDGDGDASGDGDGDASGDGDGDGDASGDGDGDMSGDGDGDMSGDGDGEPDEAPFVVMTSPDDEEVGVEAESFVDITFSEVMNPQTISTNLDDDECSGSLQVSGDNFVTCVQMAEDPLTNDNTTFRLEFELDLDSARTYQVRVTTEAEDAGGTPLDATFTTGTGFTVIYYHTIILDGVNDFTADETFASSSFGHNGYVAWDQDYVYVGLNAPDLGSDSAFTRFVGYIGGMPGSSTGEIYNTQAPALPFDARFHFRYAADDSAGSAIEWDGNAWDGAGFGPVPNGGDVAASGDFVEMRFFRADIGAPLDLALHLGMLRDQAFNEASWSAVPAGSYTDGYNPDYSEYYLFDLYGSVVPADHVAI